MSFLSICFLRSFSNLRRVWKGGTAVADLLALLATSTGRQRCWQSGVRGVSGRTSGQEGGSLHRWVVQSHGGVQNFVNAHPDARPPGCNDARSLSHCDVDQGFRSGTTKARQVGREHLQEAEERTSQTWDLFVATAHQLCSSVGSERMSHVRLPHETNAEGALSFKMLSKHGRHVCEDQSSCNTADSRLNPISEGAC